MNGNEWYSSSLLSPTWASLPLHLLSPHHLVMIIKQTLTPNKKEKGHMTLVSGIQEEVVVAAAAVVVVVIVVVVVVVVVVAVAGTDLPHPL